MMRDCDDGSAGSEHLSEHAKDGTPLSIPDVLPRLPSARAANVAVSQQPNLAAGVERVETSRGRWVGSVTAVDHGELGNRRLLSPTTRLRREQWPRRSHGIALLCVGGTRLALMMMMS